MEEPVEQKPAVDDVASDDLAISDDEKPVPKPAVVEPVAEPESHHDDEAAGTDNRQATEEKATKNLAEEDWPLAVEQGMIAVTIIMILLLLLCAAITIQMMKTRMSPQDNHRHL